jgi:hypothetical protein
MVPASVLRCEDFRMITADFHIEEKKGFMGDTERRHATSRLASTFPDVKKYPENTLEIQNGPIFTPSVSRIST